MWFWRSRQRKIEKVRGTIVNMGYQLRDGSIPEARERWNEILSKIDEYTRNGDIPASRRRRVLEDILQIVRVYQTRAEQFPKNRLSADRVNALYHVVSHMVQPVRNPHMEIFQDMYLDLLTGSCAGLDGDAADRIMGALSALQFRYAAVARNLTEAQHGEIRTGLHNLYRRLPYLNGENLREVLDGIRRLQEKISERVHTPERESDNLLLTPIRDVEDFMRQKDAISARLQNTVDQTERELRSAEARLGDLLNHARDARNRGEDLDRHALRMSELEGTITATRERLTQVHGLKRDFRELAEAVEQVITVRGALAPLAEKCFLRTQLGELLQQDRARIMDVLQEQMKQGSGARADKRDNVAEVTQRLMGRLQEMDEAQRIVDEHPPVDREIGPSTTVLL